MRNIHLKSLVLLSIFVFSIVGPIAALGFCQICPMEEHSCCVQPVIPGGLTIENVKCCEDEKPQALDTLNDLFIPAVKQLLANVLSLNLLVGTQNYQAQTIISPIPRISQALISTDSPLFILNHTLLI